MFSRVLDEMDDRAGSEYFHQIADGFCPFLQPAFRESVVRFSKFHLVGSDADIPRQIFALGVVSTEYFRAMRAAETKPHRKLLWCENVLLTFEDEQNRNVSKLLAWPHWLLKLAYLEAGVMFGKFWRGEKEFNAAGVPIPEPPVNFLSIRSAIKPKDVRFFTNQENLLPTLAAGIDDGRDCISKLTTSRSVAEAACEIREDIRSRPHSLTHSEVLDLAMRLAATPLYEEAVAWSRREHPVG